MFVLIDNLKLYQIILIYNTLNVVTSMYKKKIKKKNKITALIVSLMLLSIFSIKFNNLTTEGNKVDNNKLKISALTPPIFIDDTTPGSDWAWATGESWFGGGSGTSDDPYLLEDLIIDGFSVSDCITIHNSKRHFIIRNCTVYNGDGAEQSGIVLNNVTNGKIIKNNVTMNDWFGIYFWESKNNIISDNSVSLHQNPGIIGYYSNTTTISNNKVFNNGWGIYLDNCLNNDIIDNVVHDITTGYGIDLEDSPHNKIEGNEIRRSEGGIEVDHSNHTTVIANIAEDNVRRGIYIYLSDNVEVTGNTFKNNSKSGIYLTGSSFNNISDNIAYNNTEYGIELTPYGVYTHSNGSIITNNIIEYNKLCGIFLYNASESQILNNMIRDNPIYGAVISPDSVDNLFSENYFLKNDIHAFSFEANNDWNTTKIGNYWDNHTGPDVNPEDGIVDMPYNVSGVAGSKDYLPIAEDGAPRIKIDSPSDGDAFSSIAPNFDINVTDIYWEEIWYSIDGGLHNYSCSETGMINQATWDAPSDGYVNLTFYASDIVGTIGSNSVTISKDTTAPIIIVNSPADGEVFGADPPSFNITITEPNLDSIWYSLDNGLTIFYTNLLIGTINQTVWDALPEGSATITIYANDTLGYSSSEEVTITKDIPSKERIGLDYFMTGFLIALFSGVAIITIIAKIHFKKRIISH